MEKREFFNQLYRKYVKNQCSPEEVDELLAYLKTEGFHDIYDLIARDSANKKYPFDPILGQRLEQRLQNILSSETRDSTPIPKISPVRRMIYTRIAAVAVIFLIVAPTVYLYLQARKNGSTTAKQETAIINGDIIPGSNKPVLTLSGGRKIILDSAAFQRIAKLSNTNISIATSDRLTYENVTATATDSARPELEYNTLTNPRGSMVANLILSDGTKVWLNAGSSITYPVAFDASNRDVEITGEAYFEVTKNPHRPFTVKKMNSDTKVTVLGTHFNVNMYDDESEYKITLLEGSVKVTASAKNQLLTPGEQAKVLKDNIQLTKNVNIESVMAWKNGQFLLKGTDLAQLLRQVSRWYDVDIENRSNHSNIKFGGSIARNVNLSTVIEALKINGVICSLEGKKLVVE